MLVNAPLQSLKDLKGSESFENSESCFLFRLCSDLRVARPTTEEAKRPRWRDWGFGELQPTETFLLTLFRLQSGQARRKRNQKARSLKATMKGLRVWRVTAYANFSSDFLPTSEWPGPPQKQPKGHDKGTEGLESCSVVRVLRVVWLRKLFFSWEFSEFGLLPDFRMARKATLGGASARIDHFTLFRSNCAVLNCQFCRIHGWQRRANSRTSAVQELRRVLRVFFWELICIQIYVPAGELGSPWKFLSGPLYERYIGGLEISRLVKRCQFLNVSWKCCDAGVIQIQSRLSNRVESLVFEKFRVYREFWELHYLAYWQSILNVFGTKMSLHMMKLQACLNQEQKQS